MANVKITELTEATSADLANTNVLPIVVNTASGETPTTKKVTATNLFSLAPQPDLSGYALSTELEPFATKVSLGSYALSTQLEPFATKVSLGSYALSTQLEPFATKVSLGSINLNDIANVSAESPPDDNFLQWDGSSWVASEVSVDVDTPLAEALRGTENPHIGAYPHQPFNVLDNSAQSVMVAANSAGELDFLIPDGGNLFINTPSGGRVSPSFGFSVSEDANEPDIEVASGGENYSVISGDSDSLDPNGLPVRQGFNNPDIGAYSAPILISGGSIT